MKSNRIALGIFTTLALAASGVSNATEDLAKSSGCLACHAVDTKKVGPSFKDSAAKYKGKADAEATILAKLSTGKGHPASKVSPENQKTLVKWVLSL